MRSVVVRSLEIIAPAAAVAMRARRRMKSGSKSDVSTLLRYIKEKVQTDTAAIDIGANSGLFTFPLSRYFQLVVAVEPNFGRAVFLRRALGSNVEVLCCACGAEPAVARLLVPHDEMGNELHSLGSLQKTDASEYQRASGKIHLTSSLTTVTTIDALSRALPERVAVIKIDVEGHEKSVIEGARETLLDSRPVLFVEIEGHHGADALATFAELRERGYRCLAVNRGVLETCSETSDFVAAQHNRRIVNYLFEPT
jgi:FkbM family methyltransferase